MKKLFTGIMVLSTLVFFSYACCSQESITKATAQETLTQLISQDQTIIPLSTNVPAPSRARKDWNFIVYFAANNNLRQFAIKNIQQMLKIGSTSTMNVIIQFDELGAKEMTRYYLQKGSATPVYHETNTTASISGTRESLYNFLVWTAQNYPANHNCLVLWNHGSGIKDPSIWGRFFLTHRDEMFAVNPKTGLYELNRPLSRQYASQQPVQKLFNDRGIAFNDTFETYLTNQDMQLVLEQFNKTALNGRKIDVLCMDACMMEMIEIGSQVKNAVNYMVSSEEVEPGSGYDYSLVLAPFERGTLTPDEFSKHIVQAYAAQYYPTHADYTQSALNVALIPALEENFAQITQILTTLISSSSGSACARIIRDIRLSSEKTIEFDDTDYIDLGKFYVSLSQSLASVREATKATSAVNTLKEKVSQGLSILQRAVIANVAGSKLNQATGLSFFFPTRKLHASYLKTVFDQSTKWSGFLAKYFTTRQQPVAIQQRKK